MPRISASAPNTIMRSAILLLLAMAWPMFASAQGTLSPVGIQVFLDNSGNPLNNAKICTYAAGTSTPLATYSDVTLTTANANPVRTSSAGRPTTGGIYLSPASYKFIVLTAGTDNTCNTGTTIWSQDYMPAIPATNVALDTTGTAGEALVLGDVVYLDDGTGGTAGRWYKADADNTYSSSTAGTVGIATAAIASAASGSIRLSGRMTGLSALSAGEQYYASATAGALTATPPTNIRAIGQADTTTSLIVLSNPGNLRIPDNDGTHFLVFNVPSNLTADRLFSILPGDGNKTITLTGNPTLADWFNQNVKSTGTAPSFNLPGTCAGRLTLTTGVPVTSSDVTAAGTIYFTPYAGNTCGLYDGSATWTTIAFSEISLALTCTSGKPYDVWVYNNAGTLTLETLVWTNDTTRATALTTQNGVYVKTGVTTRRYVGSFYCTATNQTEDSFAKRNVWNYYNRVPRPLHVVDTTNSWTYTTATWREANGATTNQLEMMVGVAEVPVHVEVTATWSNGALGNNNWVAVGADVTNAPSASATRGTGQSYVVGAPVETHATLDVIPAVGRHYFSWLEFSDGNNTTTWYGDNNDTRMQSGITGTLGGG